LNGDLGEPRAEYVLVSAACTLAAAVVGSEFGLAGVISFGIVTAAIVGSAFAGSHPPAMRLRASIAYAMAGAAMAFVTLAAVVELVMRLFPRWVD
jgi:hypothetical protein